MTTLDRYVLQKFLLPFFYCLFGFIAIWFIFDLADNLPDFIQGKAQLPVLIEYYSSQVPQFVLLCLPIVELLALLYSLTAMSRSNEIISMIGTGLSVTRILMPLIFVGVVLSGVSVWVNYEGAPHAAAIRKQMLRDIKRGEKWEVRLRGHLFRNREQMRTWFVRRILVEKQELQDMQIIQQNEQGDILKQWYAKAASYDPELKQWKLLGARYVEMDPAGDIVKSEFHKAILIDGWTETPWRIQSSVMNADFLSVQELRDYLHYNSDFPENRLAHFRTQLEYRWALPCFCFVVIFLAAPMGIVYSRRGILGGVAIAIGLFFAMFCMSYLFVAFGKGGRLSPFVAAWVPVLTFFGIGLLLLWYRSTNRDLPKLKMLGF